MKYIVLVIALFLPACSTMTLTNPFGSTVTTVEQVGANVLMTVIAAKSGITTGTCLTPIAVPDMAAACAAQPTTATSAQLQAAVVACIAADFTTQINTILAKQQAAICAKPFVQVVSPPPVAPAPVK